MSLCRLFLPRDDVLNDPYVTIVQVNCGNCQRWLGDKCKDERELLNG